MHRAFLLSLLFLLAFAAGCRRAATPATSAGVAVGRSAIGQWSVVSVEGKPVPEGSSIDIDYKADGQLSVESKGDGVPPLDQNGLKAALEQMNIGGMIETSQSLRRNHPRG
jgi:hypothetical protein